MWMADVWRSCIDLLLSPQNNPDGMFCGGGGVTFRQDYVKINHIRLICESATDYAVIIHYC